MNPLSRRPFLVLQGLGAGNDNLVKQAILVMIGFGLIEYAGPSSLWTNLASALFILPFLLLSDLAGRWVATQNLRDVIIRIKNLELVCAAVAGTGLVLGNLTLLLIALAGLGAQSTLFGPSKFSWPARTERIEDLPAVTGSIEAITFIAILLGSLVGGLLVSAPIALSVLVLGLAIIGRYLAGRLPSVPPLSVQNSPYQDHPQALRSRRLISWFWFLGASYLTQLPLLTQQIMGWTAESVSWLLAAFAIGVGAGSKWVSRIPNRAQPLGFVGLIVFGISLPFAAAVSPIAGLANLLALGVAGGLYVVPLYVWMQTYLNASELPQAIGRNNRLNAALMVASAAFSIALLVLLEVTPTLYFIVLALLSLMTYPMVREFNRDYSGS